MKSAIFCLSWAFCVFEAVFAEYGDADHPETGDALKLDAYLGNCEVKLMSITEHSQNVLNAEHRKSKNTGCTHCRHICLNQSAGAFTKHYDESHTQGGTCYSKALETKDIKNDQDCCDQAVLKLKKLVKADVTTAQTCMTKCDQPGANCSKKNKNQHTDGRKKTKNEGSQTEANQHIFTYATGPESKL